MAQQQKKKKETQVSYHHRSDDMTLEQWQIALRKQAAAKELFAIEERDAKLCPGEYKVMNPVNRSEYKVVFRGAESEWNYCSCMDFKTSQLDTCKHLEAVKLWIRENNQRVYRNTPSYTSVYLSYRGKRQVKLRIGTDNADEFRQLAKPYFTDEGEMKPDTLHSITEFFRQANKLSNTFRWYQDALNFILDEREKQQRCLILQERYNDQQLDALLKATLYPYQKEGIRFAFKTGKAIIADEMGLGKTIQAIGTAEMLKKEGFIQSVLILCPTSLKYQWKKELERFTNSTVLVIEGNHLARKKQYEAEEFYKIASYNSASNDIKILGKLQTDLLIMDEVQRLKNWKTQISKNARRIESNYSVILSGTPLENKLEELYSIMQFVDQYSLGPYYQFMEQTAVTSDTGKVIGYKNLNLAGERLKSALIRRRKRDVALQLPERTDKILFVPMTKQQMGMHEEFQTTVTRLVQKWNHQRFLSETDRKRLLLAMSQMRMVCDSTYILDQKTRHDTKIDEVMQILTNVFESGDEKVVIFSQWERMTRLVAYELDRLGIRYEYLHGGIPSKKRKDLMVNFTELPESRVFLSTDAGSTGLNLQAASVLINMDLPWNPAVLEQRIARIYRIGQQRNVQVINLVANGTIESRMLEKLNFKTALFEGILDNGEDTIMLEENKFNKMVNDFAEVIAPERDTAFESQSVSTEEETEEPKEATTPLDKPTQSLPTAAPATETPETNATDEQESSLPVEAWVTEGNEPKAPSNDAAPDALLQQGISFFSGLARALASPEATQQLVNSLVKEDKETGETTLRIPVPNKDAVADVLKLVSKLFAK